MFENFKINRVSLNVVDLEKMTQFYQDIIGLSLFEKNKDHATLGIKANNLTLIELIATDNTQINQQEAGLYHTAFLLPHRSDLANYLIFASQTGYPLEGAADHGYSEALYLTDPEGNGVEIYVDKDRAEWDILADGQIKGVTEPIDLEDLLAQATGARSLMPSGTFIGHVHLSVVNLSQTEQFLTKDLNLDVVYRFGPQALFLSQDGYHHQIAVNTWSNSQEIKAENSPGLNKVTIEVSKKSFDEIQTNVVNNHSSFNEDDNQLILKDPNGIVYQLFYQ